MSPICDNEGAKVGKKDNQARPFMKVQVCCKNPLNLTDRSVGAKCCFQDRSHGETIAPTMRHNEQI